MSKTILKNNTLLSPKNVAKSCFLVFCDDVGRNSEIGLCQALKDDLLYL